MSAPVAGAATDDDLRDLFGREVCGLRPELGAFRLERAIGEGSQGIALLATRLGPDAPALAVLKLWRPSFVRQWPAHARLTLRKESIALARLGERHPPSPHVVRLYDTGEIPRQDLSMPWLALEHVDGGALGIRLKDRVARSIADSRRAFSPSRARRVMDHVVQGLVAIHEVGVLHRDLRPSNILMTGEGEAETAKVTDLGVSRPVGMHTTFGASAGVGAVGYAAPEQRSGKAMGPWTDVFSLGALLYFVLTGEPMFSGPMPVVMACVQRQHFVPLDARPHLDPLFRREGVLAPLTTALKRAVAASVDDRFVSAEELWEAVEPSLTRAADAETDGEQHKAGVAHRPAATLDLRAAASDGRGGFVALSANGLVAWSGEGRGWAPLPAPDGMVPASLRTLASLGEDLWLAAGDDGLVVAFDRKRCHFLQRLPVAGVVIDAVAPAGAGGVHLAGCDAEGRGVLWTYRVADGWLQRRPPVGPRLTALAVDAAGTVYAAGNGALVVLCGERVSIEATGIEAGPLAVDATGAVWMASRARVVRREAPSVFRGVWSHPESTLRFLALLVGQGRSVAVDAAGIVREGPLS